MSRLQQNFWNATCKLCHLQHAMDNSTKRDGGGKSEKGNLVNGNVWQRDEDQLTEKGSESHSLLSGYAEAWLSGLFDEHQHNGRPREGGPEKGSECQYCSVAKSWRSNRSESHTVCTGAVGWLKGSPGQPDVRTWAVAAVVKSNVFLFFSDSDKNWQKKKHSAASPGFDRTIPTGASFRFEQWQ